MKNWYNELENRYATFPAHIQILNLVSDLNKAKNLADVNLSGFKNQIYRALVLLDFIISNPMWKSKLGELLRLREAIASLIASQRPYASIEQIINVTLQIEPKAFRSLREGK